MKNKKLNLRTEVNLDIYDIIDALLDNFDHSELISFIRELDQGVSDWDFTEKLYSHFSGEHQIYLKGKKEDLELDREDFEL